MSSTLLRTLTKKSKLGFWNLQWTVGEMFTHGEKIDLISAYYKLTTINYTEDILCELKITKEWRIEKPGSDKQLYYDFLKSNGYKKTKRRKSRQGPDKLKSSLWELNIGLNKSLLQGKNHGR